MVQMASVPCNIDKNLEKMLSFVKEAEGSDVICFPELSLTGYELPGSALHAIDLNNDSFAAISAAAVKDNIAIAFGFAEKDRNDVYISHALADTDGTLAVYRKTHLGKNEKQHFTQGSNFVVASADKVNIGFQVCIESHFPEISTCLAYRGAELILMPFASPMDAPRRIETWKKYLPARAYDNGVFVAACNHSKENIIGGALIIDPRGNIIAESDKEPVLTADLKGNIAKRVHIDERKSMKDTDFFGSRRPELYSDVTRPLRGPL
jgi:predicted amidohydrolase